MTAGARPGLLRCRPGDTQRDGRHRQGGADFPDEGRRRRRPVRLPGPRVAFAGGAGARGRRSGHGFGWAAGRAGSHSAILATISLYPSKNLGAFGDGGAIATDDDELAELARALRFHGSRDKRTFEHVGYNSRLDEVQAAVPACFSCPSSIAGATPAGGSARPLPRLGWAYTWGSPPGSTGRSLPGTFYVVTHPRADELIGRLREDGVEARSYYRTPVHRQASMVSFADAATHLPATDELAASNLALPMSPTLTGEQIEQVVAAVARAA